MVLDKLKSMVGQKAGAAASKSLATTTHAPSSVGGVGAMITSSIDCVKKTEAFGMLSKLFEEKEWQCPCGHRFRSNDEWLVCEPVYCEVPNCPNPKFYLSGKGAAMIEAGTAKPTRVIDGKVQGAGPAGGAAGADGCTPGKTKGGVSSRFRR